MFSPRAISECSALSIIRSSSVLDKLLSAAFRMYQHLSSMVNPASMMTTFCVQFRHIASASKSNVSPYIRKKSRIRRTLRGEKPSAVG